ncbi:MAG TPA: NADH-quinone oxidoreductase subunit M, partial [Propionibacteriaceae bacterium]|nr:NADH-quinone oxidoreductase subunit M [Propionibacteriaceae bacterium]
MTFPWLTILGIIPLIGAAFMLFPVRLAARPVGLIVSFVTAAVGLAIGGMYLGGTTFLEQVPWIKTFGAWWS